MEPFMMWRWTMAAAFLLRSCLCTPVVVQWFSCAVFVKHFWDLFNSSSGLFDYLCMLSGMVTQWSIVNRLLYYSFKLVDSLVLSVSPLLTEKREGTEFPMPLCIIWGAFFHMPLDNKVDQSEPDSPKRAQDMPVPSQWIHHAQIQWGQFI